VGGVRVAQLDVPLATYAEPGPETDTHCRDRNGPFLNIRRMPFDRARLGMEYGDRDKFMARFEARLQQLVTDRWLLPEDAAREKDAARARIALLTGAP
jgi:Alpha/beta hydrolase domain